MLPQMTETQSKILMALQGKKAEDLDQFETQMRGQAGRLSMQLDQLGGIIRGMEDKLEKAKKEQQTMVGEFQGVVMAVEAYYMTKAQRKEPTEPEDPDNVIPIDQETGDEAKKEDSEPEKPEGDQETQTVQEVN